MREIDVDVLIVGAGPTGLTLAAELAANGTSLRVVDRNLDRGRWLSADSSRVRMRDGGGRVGTTVREIQMAASWVPTSCKLTTVEQPLRTGEFDDLFHSALRRIDRDGPDRLTPVLHAAPWLEQTIGDLTRRETSCCSFFTFTIKTAPDLALEVSVPPTHVDVLDASATRAADISGLTA